MQVLGEDFYFGFSCFAIYSLVGILILFFIPLYGYMMLRPGQSLHLTL